MSIKLRRCLYVGLGGTGINAILHTKKMFMETYGEVPPMIGFLGIDTDKTAFSASLDSKKGVINLNNNEQRTISASNPKAFYTNPANGDLVSWLPKENTRSITTLDRGAGQIRTNGRLAVVMNAPAIIDAIEGAMDRIRHHGTITSDRYELDSGSTKDDIHMVFSLCGGTGSGAFIDIAYLIHDTVDKSTFNLIGYAVLPDVFTAMLRAGNAMSKVKSNAFGAMQDLDFLMHLDPGSPKIVLKYSGKIIKTNEMPFSTLHLIDNKNESNITFEHINQLTEMIALTLFTSSGKIADTLSSVNDNVEKTISEGTLDVGNKRAWVSSIGACEIVFNGRDLANIYAHKAATRIIERMINSCDDANLIANNWIDSPDINIRENFGNDNLINQICDAYPKFALPEVGMEQPNDEIVHYYKTAIPSDRDLNIKLDAIQNRVIISLHELVIDHINRGDYCVTTTLSILEDISRQVDLFMGEMSEEIDELRTKKLPVLENSVKVGVENLQHWAKKSVLALGRKKHIDGAKEEIAEAVKNVASTQIGIKRRDCANKIYTALKSAIEDERYKVNSIKETLHKLRKEWTDKVIAIQNDVEKRTAVFEIDLSKGTEITIDDQTILPREFITSLPARTLYELGDSKAASNAFINYTKELSDAKKLENKTIDSVLDALSHDKFSETMRIATEKSKPLLKINGRGHRVVQGVLVEQATNKYYYVGVPNTDSSRLISNDAFKKEQPSGVNVSFISTGRHDKVILYRQEGVAPAFAVHPLDSYRQEYDNCKTFSGFDAILYKKMVEDGYDLYPKTQVDDDIEFWVKGLIFGFIKYDKTKYWYKDWDNGKALDDYWVSTGEAARDKAFDVFKRNISDIRKQYIVEIDKKLNLLETESIDKLMTNVRNNYFEQYAQCEVSRETLQKGGHKAIFTLVEEELQYVKNMSSL